MDEVRLEDINDQVAARSRHSTISSNENSLKPSSPPPKLPFRSQGLSGTLPSVPWGPPPPPRTQIANPIPSPVPQTKKLTKPFSWLSRGTSTTVVKEPVAPPSQGGGIHSDRRNTVTSITSNGTNPELMVSKFDEENESDNSATGSKRQTRNSLRDRFKLLRMREEAGIHTLEGTENDSPTGVGGVFAGLIGRSASVGFGIGSPTTATDEKDRGLGGSPIQSSSSDIPPINSLGSSVDPKLAPGTVSGISAGLSSMHDPTAPVDWDLWQSVVYEGPAAVARTSAEELNRAISSGIPSAIRGVVWQVLAQSKNEELEGVYKDLVVRGTDKDRDLPTISRGSSSTNVLINGNVNEKNAVKSSASSIHSDHSAPGISQTNGVTALDSSQEKDAEAVARMQAAVMVERKKRSKDDTIALQKLEKVIRRDMGARTSYSKYAAAAGLQDGLFGVCKAYALFDEAVSYAQGMNFLVMPLLFNVSFLCKI